MEAKVSTQTQILAERAVQLGFTDPPTYVDALNSRIGHKQELMRRVPARGAGPLRLTLIPRVHHLDKLEPLDIPLDGDWQSAFGLWACASSKCHPAKNDRGEQTCSIRCVQLMELTISITHVESGLAIFCTHPYDDRKKTLPLHVAADADGISIVERVLERLLTSGIDWGCDADMLPKKTAGAVAVKAWAPEVKAMLKADRARASAWRKQLQALDWPKSRREEGIFEAECDRFFWRRDRR